MGSKALGGELYSLAVASYTSKSMDTGHPLAVVGKELKRKEKAEVTIAFYLLPTCHEGVSFTCHTLSPL